MKTLDNVLAPWSLHCNGSGCVLVNIPLYDWQSQENIIVIPQLKEEFQFLGKRLYLPVRQSRKNLFPQRVTDLLRKGTQATYSQLQCNVGSGIIEQGGKS